MAVGGCTFSSDDIVVKSPTDRRLYRYVQLQNGLCALLVHDPEIYPDGPVEPSKTNGEDQDDDEELEEEEEEEVDDDDDDEDDDEDEGEEEEEEESEGDGGEAKAKGKRDASQSKQVCVSLRCER